MEGLNGLVQAARAKARVKATFSCATLTLTVTKIDDTPRQTSGTLYFRLDDYDEDGILIPDPLNPVHINAGILSFSYNVDLTRYSGTFPRKLTNSICESASVEVPILIRGIIGQEKFQKGLFNFFNSDCYFVP